MEIANVSTTTDWDLLSNQLILDWTIFIYLISIALCIYFFYYLFTKMVRV